MTKTQEEDYESTWQFKEAHNYFNRYAFLHSSHVGPSQSHSIVMQMHQGGSSSVVIEEIQDELGQNHDELLNIS